jgi:small-conductance mechanosensitive channel
LRVSDKVATGIKYALDEAGIDMPYPHRVVLFHDATGSRDGDIERARFAALQSATRRDGTD